MQYPNPKFMMILLAVLLIAGAVAAAPITPVDTEPMPEALALPTDASSDPWLPRVQLSELRGGFVPQETTVHGLTILIEFSDEPSVVTPAEVDAFMNDDNFTGFAAGRVSNGSVHGYFADVSGGLVDYTNAVVAEIYQPEETHAYWAAQPMDDMDILVTEALLWLDQTIGYDFTVHDGDGDGIIDAINVFTGGGVTPYNALHPHFSDGLNVVLDGVTATHYENTDISTTGLQLAVVCHENGHQLFGWPDLYLVSGSSVGNLKGFCLMGMVFGGNPPHPNAYLKIEAGWMNPHVLDPELASNFLRSDVNTASILTHAYGTSGTESYILENRQQVGRDEGIADSGIAIYRVIEDGDNVSVVLVEADGDYAMLEGANGTSTDLWSGPGATEFDFATTPAAIWSNGDYNMMRITDISANATLMTFVYEEYDPAPVAIRPWPDAISAPWTLTGPGGVLQEGAGYEDLVLPGDLNYMVTFGDVPLWTTPTSSPVTAFAPAGVAVTFFNGFYGTPVAPLSGSGLSDTGDAVASAVIDFDDDGDEDLFVLNAGSANQLLRNDGFYTYTDVTPANLANAEAIGSAWSDVDGDGDQDVFLYGADGTNLLFEATATNPPAFNDVTAQATALNNLGVLNSASWIDIDRDGLIELFVTRHDATNLRFELTPGTYFGFTSLDAGFAATGSNTEGAAWGDLNNDGWPDLLIGSFQQADDSNARLVMNDHGNLVYPTVVGFRWFEETPRAMVDFEYADFNRDGLTDVAMRSAYGWIGIYLQTSLQQIVFYDCNLSGFHANELEIGDFNCDGYMDLYCATEEGPDFIALNDNNVDDVERTITFTAAPIGFDGLEAPVRTAAVLDANNDGGPDVFVGRSGVMNSMMLNYIPAHGNWLKLDLTGVTVHPDAAGAKVHVYVGGEVLERDVEAGGDTGQSSSVVHFGLGDATSVDAVIVTWSGGLTTTLTNVAANQTLDIVESAAKSDPEQESPVYVTTFKKAYPNPFNPTTNIAFTLGQAGHVQASIYAVNGRKVMDLVNGTLAAGNHEYAWHGTDDGGRRVSSGTYFCRIQTESGDHTLKMVLLK